MNNLTLWSHSLGRSFQSVVDNAVSSIQISVLKPRAGLEGQIQFFDVRIYQSVQYSCIMKVTTSYKSLTSCSGGVKWHFILYSHRANIKNMTSFDAMHAKAGYTFGNCKKSVSSPWCDPTCIK